MKFTFVINLLFLNDKPACVASVVNLSSVLSCRHLSNATPRFPRVLARLWLWRCCVVGRCSSAPLWIELLKPWWLVAAWWKSALCCINIKQTPHIPPALYVRIAQKVKYCFKSLFAPKNSSVTDPNTQAPTVKKTDYLWTGHTCPEHQSEHIKPGLPVNEDKWPRPRRPEALLQRPLMKKEVILQLCSFHVLVYGLGCVGIFVENTWRGSGSSSP